MMLTLFAQLHPNESVASTNTTPGGLCYWRRGLLKSYWRHLRRVYAI